VEEFADEAARGIAQGADVEAVAQEIRDDFFAGGVSDVAIVGVAAFFGRHFADDETDADAAHVVERSEPFGVALDEVVVDGDDVARVVRPAGEDGGETGGERFAFAGGHFDEVTAMEAERAHELDDKRAHAHRAMGGFANRGERRNDSVFGGAAGAAEDSAMFEKLFGESAVGEVADNFVK